MAPKKDNMPIQKFNGTPAATKVHAKVMDWCYAKFKGNPDTGEEGIHPELWFKLHFAGNHDKLQASMNLLLCGFPWSRP